MRSGILVLRSAASLLLSPGRMLGRPLSGKTKTG